jgi:hypothetical protein
LKYQDGLSKNISYISRPLTRLMPGEMIEFDSDKIFVNHVSKNYTLKPSSSAIDAGIDMPFINPVEVKNLM